MPEKSEIYEIPGNLNLTPAERYARTAALYIPFHDRINSEIERILGEGRKPVIVTIHTFTPVYFGKSREVEIGILHDTDSRLADAMLRAADGGPYRVERNSPYGPEDGVTHTLRLHALPKGYANVMIEVRNDLVRDEGGVAAISAYLADLISAGLQRVA